MKRKRSQELDRTLAAAKELLKRVPLGVVVIPPKNYRFVDPVPKPSPDCKDVWYLEQASLGRWIDSVPGRSAEGMWDSFKSLARYLAKDGEPYLFPEGASSDQRERLIDVLTRSYARGFYLALLRYADDLDAVPEAAAIRAALERGRKKGADVVRQKAAPKKTAIRKRFRELRKSGFTKTDARKVLEQETGFSFRQIERDTKGLT